MTIDVWIDGLPKAQPRPRAFARAGHARVYDPGTAEGWKGAVALALRPWAGKRVGGPVRLSLLFSFLRPASHRTGAGVLRKGAPVEHVSKPDADNLVKAVLDACTGIGIWRDDTQVVSLTAQKRYSDVQQGCRFQLEA